MVDNASIDLSVEFIRQKVPDAKLIINRVNLGFKAANNPQYALRKHFIFFC